VPNRIAPQHKAAAVFAEHFVDFRFEQLRFEHLGGQQLLDLGLGQDGDDPSNGHGLHGTNTPDDIIVDHCHQIKTRQ
jgi:hypothetical protein